MSKLKLSSTTIIISNLVILAAVVAISYPAIKKYVDAEIISARFQAIEQMGKVSNRLSKFDAETTSDIAALNKQLDNLVLRLAAYQKITNQNIAAVEAAQNKEQESNVAILENFNRSYSELAEVLFNLKRQYTKLENQLALLEDQVAEGLKTSTAVEEIAEDPYNF